MFSAPDWLGSNKTSKRRNIGLCTQFQAKCMKWNKIAVQFDYQHEHRAKSTVWPICDKFGYWFMDGRFIKDHSTLCLHGQHGESTPGAQTSVLHQCRHSPACRSPDLCQCSDTKQITFKETWDFSLCGMARTTIKNIPDQHTFCVWTGLWSKLPKKI